MGTNTKPRKRPKDGAAYYQDGKYEKAIEAFNQALKADPADVASLFGKANSFTALGKTREALRCYDRIVSIRPTDSSALLFKANLLAWEGQLDDAVMCYDEALRRDPDSAEILRHKAFALRRERPDEALQCYEHLLRLNADDARAWWDKGDVLLSMGRQDAAFECFAKGEALGGDPIVAAREWSARGDRLSVDLQRRNDALFCYEKSLAADPRSAWTWRAKANVLASEPAQALNCIEKALVIEPGNVTILVDKGNLLVDLKRNAEAKECYESALRINPKDYAALVNKAITLENERAYKHALRFVERAIRVDATRAEAWLHKGICQSELGLYEESLRSYDRAIAVRPDYLWAWNNKGSSVSKLGRYQESIALFEKAIEIDGGETLPWCNKAGILRRLERYAEARHCLEEALPIVRDRASVLSDLGSCFAEDLSEYAKAIECFRQALDLEPTNHIAKASLAESLIALGMHEDGRACATEVKEQTTDPALQRVLSYLIMTSYALQGDAHNRSRQFTDLIERIADYNGSEKLFGTWTFRGFSRAVARSDVDPEAKFLALTISDLQGDLARATLSFFSAAAQSAR